MKMKKYFIGIIMLACSLLIQPQSFAASQFLISRMKFDTQSLILKNDRYYAPYKTVLWETNANCNWNNEEKTLTLLWRGNRMIFTANSKYVLYNDKPIEIVGAPFMEGEVFYIPVRVIEELFGGEVLYDKEKDTLTLKLELETYRVKTSNPLEAIDQIKEVDYIEVHNPSKGSIDITDKDEIDAILKEYFNNNYTRVEHVGKHTTGFWHSVDLYAEGEHLIRIWVITNNLISFQDDSGYYELETPLTHF